MSRGSGQCHCLAQEDGLILGTKEDRAPAVCRHRPCHSSWPYLHNGVLWWSPLWDDLAVHPPRAIRVDQVPLKHNIFQNILGQLLPTVHQPPKAVIDGQSLQTERCTELESAGKGRREEGTYLPAVHPHRHLPVQIAPVHNAGASNVNHSWRLQ